MKWVCVFFCKKVDLSSTQGALCTVSVFLISHFTYLGGEYAPNAPPAYGPADLRQICRIRRTRSVYDQSEISFWIFYERCHDNQFLLVFRQLVVQPGGLRLGFALPCIQSLWFSYRNRGYIFTWEVTLYSSHECAAVILKRICCVRSYRTSAVPPPPLGLVFAVRVEVLKIISCVFKGFLFYYRCTVNGQ